MVSAGLRGGGGVAIERLVVRLDDYSDKIGAKGACPTDEPIKPGLLPLTLGLQLLAGLVPGERLDVVVIRLGKVPAAV